MKKQILLFLFSLLVVVSFAQNTISIPVSQDATIVTNAPTTNYGSSPYLESYPWGSQYSRRFLIQFDLSQIPANANIVSAKIILTVANSHGYNRDVDAHLITAPWDENTVTWNSFSNQFGSFSASDLLVWPSSNFGEWDVTGDVQSMVNGQTNNYGWLFKDQSESFSQHYWFFASKESALNSPVLEVTYEENLNPLQVTSTINNVSCHGGNNGSILVNVSGGNNAGYNYTWSPSSVNGQGTSSISNLSAGNYSLEVVDAVDSTISLTQNFVIQEPNEITFITTTSSSSCGSCNNGIIEITAQGGTPSYQYSINGGQTYFGTNVFENLSQGSYELLIKDNNNCFSISQTVQVDVAPLNLSYTVQGASVNTNDGAIDLTITGGTQPYTVVWSNGWIEEDLLNIAPGKYTVNVSDANGQTASAEISVSSKVDWHMTYMGIGISNGGFQSTLSSWGSSFGESVSDLKANENGGVKTVMNSTSDYNHQWAIGLSGKNSGQSIKYKIVNWTGGGYDVYVNNVWYASSGIYASVGDEIEVRREGDAVFFFVNSILVSSVSVNPAEILVADIELKQPNVSISNAQIDFAKQPRQNVQTSKSYFHLNSEINGDFGYTENGELNFLFRNIYGDYSELDFQIYDRDENIVASTSNQSIAVSYGLNKISIDVGSLSNTNFYTLEVIDSNGDRKYLKFKVYE